MADVWRNRTPRGQRRSRRLGTIDGRLIGASQVKSKELTRRPNDTLHPIMFSSGGLVTDDQMSPPFVVEQDGIIIGLKLSTEADSVRSDIYVNGTKRASITRTGAGLSTKEDLDIGVEGDSKITIKYHVLGGAPTDAVTTVNFLED